MNGMPTGGASISFANFAPAYAAGMVAPVNLYISRPHGHPHTSESARSDTVEYSNGARLQVWLGDNGDWVRLKLPEGRTVREAAYGGTSLVFQMRQGDEYYPLRADISYMARTNTVKDTDYEVAELRITDNEGAIYIHNVVFGRGSQYAPKGVDGEYTVDRGTMLRRSVRRFADTAADAR